MIRLDRGAFEAMCEHAVGEYPLEMCGLVAGPSSGDDARAFYPCHNDAASAKVYTVNPGDFMRAERAADARDWDIIGVVHSHTHSQAYPSPTDVAQAPDPAWHYLIVSLQHETPELRSFRIVDGVITEEPVNIA